MYLKLMQYNPIVNYLLCCIEDKIFMIWDLFIITHFSSLLLWLPIPSFFAALLVNIEMINVIGEMRPCQKSYLFQSKYYNKSLDLIFI